MAEPQCPIGPPFDAATGPSSTVAVRQSTSVTLKTCAFLRKLVFKLKVRDFLLPELILSFAVHQLGSNTGHLLSAWCKTNGWELVVTFTEDYEMNLSEHHCREIEVRILGEQGVLAWSELHVELLEEASGALESLPTRLPKAALYHWAARRFVRMHPFCLNELKTEVTGPLLPWLVDKILSTGRACWELTPADTENDTAKPFQITRISLKGVGGMA